MAGEENRYTAAEWERIQSQYHEQPKRGVRAMFPDPTEECELGPFIPQGSFRPSRVAAPVFEPHPHLRVWFASLSEDDVKSLQALLSLRPETITWVGQKNDRELKQLDGAVEFITSSRTAARVLMWCCGTAVAFVAGVVALTKNGIDMFQILRGGK